MKEYLSRIVVFTILGIVLTALIIQPSQNSITIMSYGLEEVKPNNFDHSYSSYNMLLNQYVEDAKVNYEGFISQRAEFAAFLRTLGSVDENDFQTWTEKQKIAFWINAYNAFTIKAIIDHYPIKRGFSLVGIFYAPSNSILQIKGVWTKLQFRAVGKMVTLEEIEHEILRKKFNEPRIHMAINCASISCPDLSSEAYTPDKLEEQLAQASVRFVNNPQKGVSVNQDNRKVKFSKIFKWFGEDFIKNYGNNSLYNNYSLKENSILSFSTEYIESEKIKQYLMNNKLKLGYLG
jgi:hypothetical protein